MKKLLLIPLLLSLFFLVACVTTNAIGIHQLSNLSKGMSEIEVYDSIGIRPLKSIQVKANGKYFLVDVYQLANGNYYSDYFLAFDKSLKLVFWGYPNEFSRSKNKTINKIGEIALTAWRYPTKQK